MTNYAAKADAHEGRCEWNDAASAWGHAISAAEASGQDVTIMRARKAACEHTAKASLKWKRA